MPLALTPTSPEGSHFRLVSTFLRWVEKKTRPHHLAWPALPSLTSHSSNRCTPSSTHSNEALLCPQILSTEFAHLPAHQPPALHMSFRPRLHVIHRAFPPNSQLPVSESPRLLPGNEATANHFTFLRIKIFGKQVFEEMEMLPLLRAHHSVLGCSKLS